MNQLVLHEHLLQSVTASWTLTWPCYFSLSLYHEHWHEPVTTLWIVFCLCL